MRNQPEQFAKRFAQSYVGDMVMSAITYAEQTYGVAVSANRARERRNLAALTEYRPVAPLDASAAEAHGPIRDGYARANEKSLGQADCCARGHPRRGAGHQQRGDLPVIPAWSLRTGFTTRKSMHSAKLIARVAAPSVHFWLGLDAITRAPRRRWAGAAPVGRWTGLDCRRSSSRPSPRLA
ncbi:hypothetical protein CO2235_MP10388 [Cupriavidus oxalaticus]|uniref:Uncharacterized protein n=1 Tax=Cupriavidus oxalaticus TaxID=96344 RepID=A0A375GA16_9BURK|nr:hypothetical protein CO2235_U1010044 [Cupriavidus oxalaticus]SPC18211.1 hypothetical protein CO2235_MP10388 [Cupriavidus oxalaticus]